MGKKALAAVSFGTTYADALDAIEQIETRLHAEEPGCMLFRAFTSRMVIKKLRESGVEVCTPTELFERLRAEGYTEVLCQPTHIISGVEYDKLYAEALKYAPLFTSFRIGSPLLTAESDYINCCKALAQAVPMPRPREALVLMGHGTEHFANAAYCQLENTFRALGHERVYVGTVEGFPALDYIIQRLKKHDIDTVRLMPFMVVAGDHAKNDLAGADEHSWNSRLAAEGYRTELILRGLGTFAGIQEIFAEHMQGAKEIKIQEASL